METNTRAKRLAAQQSVDFNDQPIKIEGQVRPEEDMRSTIEEKDLMNPYGYKDSVREVSRAEKVAPSAIDPIENKFKEGQDQGFNWGDLLVGATPVLMGHLVGETEAGYKLGGQGLLDRYKEGVENRRLRQKREAAANGNRGTDRFFPQNIEVDGKTIKAVFNQATGKFRLPDGTEVNQSEILAGYSPRLVKDPTTDEYSKLTGQKDLNPIAGAQPQRMTIRQQKLARDVRDNLLKDKRFSQERNTVGAANRALSLLSLNNPVADEGLKTIFPRLFGEVGNLAAAEQERFGGSRALLDSLSRIGERLETGNLTDKDRRYLIEVATVMREYSAQNLKNTAEAYLQSEQNVGFDASTIVEPFINERIAQPQPTKARVRSKLPTTGKPEIVEQNGVKFKLDANGQYQPMEN